MPDFHTTVGETIWREGGVRCVMVPSSVGTAVELRTEQGGVFLRKQAPTITAARNEGGATTFLDVLAAQQSLLSAERLAAQLGGQRLLTSVFLIKALGGDWLGPG